MGDSSFGCVVHCAKLDTSLMYAIRLLRAVLHVVTNAVAALKGKHRMGGYLQ